MSSYTTRAGCFVWGFSLFIFITSLTPHRASAGNEPDHRNQYASAEHLLDGIRFQYFYNEGGGLEIRFAEGTLQYKWISGPRKGNHAENIPYQSRRIGEELFLVNWHQPDRPDFVSLVINLKELRLYSSAILRCGSENEMIHFKEAQIKNVKRDEMRGNQNE